MKKVLFLSTFFALSFFSAQAQFGGGTESNLKLIVGATGGVNFSWYGLSEEWDAFSTKTQLGFNGGLTVGLATSDRFSILLGANFIQKGSKLEGPTDDYTENGTGIPFKGYFSGKENTQFLTVPIMARYQVFGDGESFGVTLAAGLSLNFALGGDYSSSIQGTTGKSYNAASGKIKFGSGITDAYDSFQAGILLSPGVVFPVGEKGKFTVNVTWDLGLSDMFNSRYKEANDVVGKWRNRSTIFTVGYEHRFELGSSSR